MNLPTHKTKIIATIGPASSDAGVMAAMIRAGLDIARLNFSHGTLEDHGRNIETLRAAARAVGREISILADLPGPKIRIGTITGERVDLIPGAPFTLTTVETEGDATRAFVSLSRLPDLVRPGDALFINDGLVRVDVERVAGNEVHCRVVVGGEIRSRKGLNLPGIDLATEAFTENDRRCLEFALAHGVDAVGQSFVESARDVESVRKAAARTGASTFVIAKIERSRALDRIDEIIAAADGIMIARGDLGVEIPLEGIAIVQKDLMRKARIAGKPVITATQMLESMIHSRHPTRAEATDVANAVLDGTDCLMLSAESASGAYPVEAVATLARIAAATEPSRQRFDLWERIRDLPESLGSDLGMLTAVAAQSVMEATDTAVVFAPTRTGRGPRDLARFRMPAWIVAVTGEQSVARQLALSFGVHVICRSASVGDWRAFVRGWARERGISGAIAMLVREAEVNGPASNHALELIDLVQ